MIKFLKQLSERAIQELRSSDTNGDWNTNTIKNNSNVEINISTVAGSGAQHELTSSIEKTIQELTEFENVLIALSKLEKETKDEK